MKKINLILITLFSLLLMGCSQTVQTIEQTNTNNQETKNQAHQNSEIENFQLPIEILTLELENVNTGEKYNLEQFIDKPILIETFAVWCPSCTNQQKTVKKLHNTFNDDQLISIALNIDPNEDKSKILEHTQSNGFDWRYSISTEQLTTYLTQEFGLEILSAPRVPMILICPNSKPEFLKTGFKSEQYLIEKVNSCNT